MFCLPFSSVSMPCQSYMFFKILNYSFPRISFHRKSTKVGFLLCLAHSQIVLMIRIGMVGFFMQCMFGNKIITWLVNYFILLHATEVFIRVSMYLVLHNLWYEIKMCSVMSSYWVLNSVKATFHFHYLLSETKVCSVIAIYWCL
jgi:hypothetical protein